ncbi:MAG: hypothetical protein OEW04_04245 [Nitrospirota bacterium]|nr:hypothetical protein [Nitrospirota bacterium]
MVHILIVAAVEESQLLIAVCRIIGAIKVRNNPLRFPLLVPPDIQVKKLLCHPVEVPCCYGVLKP